MSQMKTTLTLNDDDYDVTFNACVNKAEPETREYPGCDASISNDGIVSVIKNQWDDAAKNYTQVNLPYELFKGVWDELEDLLDAQLDKSGLDMLHDLAEQMEDRYNREPD